MKNGHTRGVPFGEQCDVMGNNFWGCLLQADKTADLFMTLKCMRLAWGINAHEMD